MHSNVMMQRKSDTQNLSMAEECSVKSSDRGCTGPKPGIAKHIINNKENLICRLCEQSFGQLMSGFPILTLDEYKDRPGTIMLKVVSVSQSSTCRK